MGSTGVVWYSAPHMTVLPLWTKLSSAQLSSLVVIQNPKAKDRHQLVAFLGGLAIPIAEDREKDESLIGWKLDLDPSDRFWITDTQALRIGRDLHERIMVHGYGGDGHRIQTLTTD